MALSIDKGHTALLAMDFENDIVHENGGFKDFGFAAMVKQNDVLAKSARLLDAARRSGVKSDPRRHQVPPRLPGTSR